MKRAIENLETALEDITEAGYIEPDNSLMSDALYRIKDALTELKAPPRWETPEQREKRTGEPWPDDWPVYCCGQTDEFAKRYDALLKRPHGYTWMCMTYKKANNYEFYKMTHIICATEAGPPPDGWRPEDNQ